MRGFARDAANSDPRTEIPPAGHATPNAMMAHLPLDPATACMVSLRLEFEMNTRAHSGMTVAMDPIDVLQQLPIGRGPGTFQRERHA